MKKQRAKDSHKEEARRGREEGKNKEERKSKEGAKSKDESGTGQADRRRLGQGGPRRQHQGEWTELRFMSEAARRGFSVLRPWSRSCYDVLVDHSHVYLRVQVKSAGRPRKLQRVQQGPGTVYGFRTRRHKRPYRASDIDFYALYIVPRDLWYIIPYGDIGPVQILCLFPDNRGHRLEQYREAWDLLRKDRGTGDAVGDLMAAGEEGAGARR